MDDLTAPESQLLDTRESTALCLVSFHVLKIGTRSFESR